MAFFNASLRYFTNVCRLALLVPLASTAAPPPSGLQLGQAEVRVSEASKAARIPVVRTGSLAGAVSAQLNTSDGTAISGQDYVGTNVIITLPSGVAAGAVLIPVLWDSVNEPTETVNLLLTGTNVGPRSAAVLSILDNDPAGVINFATPYFKISETGSVALVKLSRTGGTASGVSVMVATSDGTATADADYTGAAIRVAFGANETTKTVPIAVADDLLAEGNETVNLEILKPDGGASLGKQTNATLTIVDNEIALGFSRAAYSVPEQGGVALITVMRSGPLNQAVSVNVSTAADSTATPGAEYKPLTNLLVRFPAGVAAKVVAVSLKDDTLDDGDKTVELELSDPSAPAQLGTIQKTVVTLADNDAGGTINFTVPMYNTLETAGKAPIIIRRTGGAASGVTVQLRTSNGTAEAGTDYQEVVTNLTFKAGELVKAVYVPILNDSIVEDTETVNLTLSDPTGGAVLGTNVQAVLRVANDDRGGAIQFAAASFSVSEIGTNAVITLVRSSGLAAGVEVEVAVTGGTATLGEDYTGLPAVAAFAPGATTAKVLAPIVNDAVIEGVETVGLELRNPTGGASLGLRTNATLAIRDDELKVTGVYKGPLNYTFSGCQDQSDNESGTMSCEVNITDQTADTFVGSCTLIGASCGNAASLEIAGQLGPLGGLSGTFRDDYDTRGTITGQIVSGTIQLNFSGQPGSNGCRVRASLSGKVYSPSAEGFAPEFLTGLKIETTQTGSKAQIDYVTQNRFNRRNANGEITGDLYTYTKTGLNTGVMRTSTVGEDQNSTVSIIFVSATQGRYTYTACDGGTGSGTFVVGDFTVPDPTPEYQVWGGASFSTSEPEWWEKGYHPGEHGYVLLGSADITSTFAGSYAVYIIRTAPGYAFKVDAVQGSDGAYFGTSTSGNVENWWNISGPPDGAACDFGKYPDSGSFVIIDAEGHALSSITVYLTP